MVFNIRKIKKIFRNLVYASFLTVEHGGIEHAGYMSFMMLLSMFPFIVFILALAKLFGASDSGKDFIIFLIDLSKADIPLIRSRVREILNEPIRDLLNLAWIGVIWTSSSFFEAIRTILNKIYNIKNVPSYFLRRLLSIAQFLIVSTFFICVMILFVFIPIILKKFVALSLIDILFFTKYSSIIYYAKYCFLFIFLFCNVCGLYYIIPNVKIRFANVIPGAILTVSLWIIGGQIFTNYIVYFNQLNFIYGSIGGVILILMFFYVINIILIYGAEFNYLLTHDL